MNLRSVIASSLLAWALYPSPAEACRCKEPKTSSAYKRADIVVIARVLDVVPNVSIGGVTATLSVLRSWKGAVAAKITVESGTTCQYPFRASEEFLLFILRDARGGLSTARCLGNKPEKEAAPSLKWLERHGTPGTVVERGYLRHRLASGLVFHQAPRRGPQRAEGLRLHPLDPGVGRNAIQLR